jgi:hypothetical protein
VGSRSRSQRQRHGVAGGTEERERESLRRARGGGERGSGRPWCQPAPRDIGHSCLMAEMSSTRSTLSPISELPLPSTWLNSIP